MINYIRLKNMVDEKRRNREQEEESIKLYNQAISLDICPSCGKHETIMILADRLKCSNCDMTALYCSVTSRYEDFEDGHR